MKTDYHMGRGMQPGDDGYTELCQHIGQKLALLRHERGELQVVVSRATHISTKVISQVENGRYPAVQLAVLYRLCAHYGIVVADLFGPADAKKNNVVNKTFQEGKN